ncbi:hypothetical protein ACEPAG_43 [Sanghuangporus baumii]
MYPVNEVVPQLHAPDIHLGNTLGAELIGLIFSAFLFGVINVQVHTYYQSRKDEPRFLKWMIAFVWFLNAFLLALISYYDYFIFVTHFADLTVIGQVPWCFSLFSTISEISLFIIRLFYTRRIWIMSDRNLILTAFAFNIVFAAKLFSAQSFFDISKFSWLMLTGNATAAAADLWNAIPLCYFLRRGKSGLRKTDTMIKKLMIYIVGTGLLTSMVALTCFITYVAMPRSMISVATYSCVSPLYFNAMLASVNSRKRLRNEMVDKSITINFETRRVASAPPHGILDSGVHSTPQSKLPVREDLCGDPRLSPVTFRTEVDHHTVEPEARLDDPTSE